VKPVYRVVGILAAVMGARDMFAYRQFWQFCITVVITLGGLILFGENYD
jgi:hypothetical protein